MVQSGLAEHAVDEWLSQQGSPSEFTFEIQFADGRFAHSVATPDVPLQIGERGTYVLEGDDLRLTVPGEGGSDEYRFDVEQEGDELRLALVDLTESGTSEAREIHRIFTTGFYSSAPFHRGRERSGARHVIQTIRARA